MPEVNLDDLMPEDLVFIYREVEYRIPGDCDTESVLKMLRLFQLVMEARRKALEAETDEQKKKLGREIDKAYDEIRAILLELFRINHPELTELPFGVAAMPHVINGIFELLGVTSDPQRAGTTPRSTTSRKKNAKPSGKRKPRSASR